MTSNSSCKPERYWMYPHVKGQCSGALISDKYTEDQCRVCWIKLNIEMKINQNQNNSNEKNEEKRKLEVPSLFLKIKKYRTQSTCFDSEKGIFISKLITLALIVYPSELVTDDVLNKIENQKMKPKRKILVCHKDALKKVDKNLLKDWLVICDNFVDQLSYNERKAVSTLLADSFWISYINNNSYLDIDYISKLHSFVEKRYYNINVIGAVGVPKSSRFNNKLLGKELILSENCLKNTLLYRRDVVLQCGNWLNIVEEDNNESDWQMCYFMSLLGYKLFLSDEFDSLLIEKKLTLTKINEKIINRIEDHNLYKKILEKYGLTVFTPFSGRHYCFELWFNTFLEIPWPKNTKFIWCLSNENPEFSQLLFSKAQELCCYDISIKKSLIPSDFDILNRAKISDNNLKLTKLTNEHYRILKTSVVNSMYNQCLQSLETKFLMIYEDDVIPKDTQNLLNLLLIPFQIYKNTIGVGGIVLNESGIIVGCAKSKVIDLKYKREPIYYKDVTNYPGEYVPINIIASLCLVDWTKFSKFIPCQNDIFLFFKETETLETSYAWDTIIFTLMTNQNLGNLYLAKNVICDHFMSPDRYVKGDTLEVINFQEFDLSMKERITHDQ